MSILVHDGPGEPNPFNGFAKAVAMKTEDGQQYPAAAFAYVPDAEKPSTWKLRLWQSPSEKVTRAQVGAALAALSPGGFRGQPVQIPDVDMPKVKSRVLSAWKSVHEADDEVPSVLKSVVLKHGSHDQSSHGTPAAGGPKSNVAQRASAAGVQIQATGTKGVYNGHPDSTRKYVIMEAEDGTASLSAGTRGRGATLTEHPNVGAAERAMVDHEKRASDMDGLLGSPKRSRDESANWGSGEMGGRYDGGGRPTR